jgi:hypothetical protein
MAIKPGNFASDTTDYGPYVNSMAAEIERQLNLLLELDDLPALPGNPSDAHPDEDDREVRDRRRLFVAIARAVVKHLNDNRTAIDIQVPDGLGGTVTVHPSFDIEGL